METVNPSKKPGTISQTELRNVRVVFPALVIVIGNGGLVVFGAVSISFAAEKFTVGPAIPTPVSLTFCTPMESVKVKVPLLLTVAVGLNATEMAQ